MRLEDSLSSFANVAGKTCRDFGYEVQDQWGVLPAGWRWQEAVGVAADSQDRVFVFDRGEHPVTIFDRNGAWLGSWGEGLFARPHGITIGPDDAVYCTDDLQQTVRKFTPDGRLLLTLGTAGSASDTGATSVDYRTILRAGPPFHFPTNLALSPSGEMYVSDGYGNARIHKFSPDGELLLSWGEPVPAPASFTCRMASSSIDTQPCMWPTARIVACNSSLQRVSSFPSGPISPGPARCSSTSRTTYGLPSSAFAQECGLGLRPPHRMPPVGE